MIKKIARAVGFTLMASAATFSIIAWVLAGRLRKAAFLVTEPDDRPDPDPITVLGIDDGSIELDFPRGRQDVAHPGIIGLSWDDGYMQAADVLSSSTRSVARAVAGDVPPLGSLMVSGRGPRVRVDPYSFPHSPADRGLEFEEIEFSSSVGTLGAWVVPGGSPGSWAIHVHGWGATRLEHLRMLPPFHRAGLTSMVIDYRNDPGAPRDASGHYRFGLSEWADLEAAVAEARRRGAERVIFMGCSTGGAIILSALERSPLVRDVACGLVLDAPNLAMEDTVRLHARNSPFLGAVMAIADLRWDIGWEALNYLERVERIVELPALVFHGTADDTVPISVSRSFAERLPHLVDLCETEGAGHVMSWNVDPERYERRVEAFVSSLELNSCGGPMEPGAESGEDH